MAVRKQDFSGDNEQKPTSKKRTRITFDVSDEVYLKIKMEALKHHLSVSSYLLNIIEPALPKEVETSEYEKRPLTPEAFQQILQARERILQETNEAPIEDSAELIRKQREERTRQIEEALQHEE